MTKLFILVHAPCMARKMTILNTDGAELGTAGILRQVWCRSCRAPALFACASQRQIGEDREWVIDALKPLKFDPQGIPHTFQFQRRLENVPGLTAMFSYLDMLDRMSRNYSPSLYDPLKQLVDHYEDERRSWVRGMPRSAPKTGPSPSLTHEKWAQRASLVDWATYEKT